MNTGAREPTQPSDVVPYPPPPEACDGQAPSILELPPGDYYIREFLSLLEPTHALRKHGYNFAQLTDEEIHLKRRCSKCNQTIQQLSKGLQQAITRRSQQLLSHPPDTPYKTLPSMIVPYENGSSGIQYCTVECLHHSAPVDRATKCWLCCGKHVSEAQPCRTSDKHRIREYRPGELERLHQFQPTPPFRHWDADRRMNAKFAVAIDCEMGTARSGDSELIRLSAIDYLTGEVLINNLVKPDQPMQHLNTKWSGVTWDQMNEAVREKTTLKGKTGARKLLWKFVGPDTILVGHSVHNDLKALKWIHTKVVDSYVVEHKIIQEKKAVEAREKELSEEAARRVEECLLEVTGLATSSMLTPATDAQTLGDSTNPIEGEPKKKKKKGTGDLALKTLLKKYLDTDIQTKGNKGHDSLEDATAARDLVHWMVMRRLQDKYGVLT